MAEVDAESRERPDVVATASLIADVALAERHVRECEVKLADAKAALVLAQGALRDARHADIETR